MDAKEADELLDRWGIWSRSYHRIGWATTSILGRIAVEGHGAAHQTEYAGIPMADDVAQAEKSIAGMPFSMKRAVKSKYLWRLRDNDAAKRCYCGKTSYRAIIENAKWYLVANISD